MIFMNARLKKAPATIAPPETLVGHTLRWEFDDGPVAGKTFEHRFNEDGSVEFRMLDAAGKGRWTHVDKCAARKINDDVFAMSYLGTWGYTLSVVLNFQSREMVAFASNEKAWSTQEGTFQLIR